MGFTQRISLVSHTIFVCLILFAGLCIFDSPAIANEKVKIAILSRTPRGGMSTERAAWLQRYLRWSMRKRTRVELVSDKDVERLLTMRKIPPGNAARIRVMRRFLKKAKALYGMTRFPLQRRCQYVLRALNVASKLANHLQSYLEEPDLMRDLYLYHTIAYMGLQNQAKTREYMLLLVQADPNFQPETPEYPPSFVQYHRAVSSWLRRQPRYTMQIDSTPSGAQIYHNYRLIGATPYQLSDLMPGKHYIRLVKPNYLVWERTANLTREKLGSRQSVNVNIPLRRDPKALSIDPIPIFAQDAAISDDIIDKLEKIAERLDVKYLYIVEPRQTTSGNMFKMAIFKRGVRQIRYDAAPIGNSRNSFRARIATLTKRIEDKIAPPPPPTYRPKPYVARTPTPTPTPVSPTPENPPPRRTVITSPRQVAAVQPRPRPSIRPKPPSGGTPFYSTWWFWTATIGGAIVATTAVVLVVNMNGPPPSATLIITTQAPTNSP